jgi:hypothetical protein
MGIVPWRGVRPLALLRCGLSVCSLGGRLKQPDR